MKWNNRVFREVLPTGEQFYSIREVYYDESDKPKLYSAEPRPAMGESVAELAETLDRMRRACTYPVLTERDFPKP